MSDLKPLFELVKPGVPCEVEQRDTYLCRYRYDGEKFDRMVTFAEGMRPVWRLVPPAPLLKWEPDPEAFVAGEHVMRNTRDGSKQSWLVRWFNSATRWFATRAECEQWAEDHARKNHA